MAPHGVKAWGPPLTLAVALMAGGALMFTALAKPSDQVDDAANGSSPAVTTSSPGVSAEAATPQRGPIAAPTDADPATSIPASDVTTTSTPSDPPTEPNMDPSVPDADIDCTKVKCAALTFDDGPDTNTAKVLNVLKEKDVKATFFVQGYRIERFAKYLKRAADEGHVIGNHSWDHPYLTKLKKKAIAAQIDRTNEAVKQVTGQVPYLVRPPFGAYNDLVLKTVGAPLIMWDVDTRDWTDKTGNGILKNLKKELRPGAIIIMHDTVKGTAKRLADVIDYIRKKGYTLVTVPTLLNNTFTSGEVYYSQP